MAGLDLVFVALLLGLLLPMAVIDLRERRIPNPLNLAIAILGLLHGVVRHPELQTLFAELLDGALTLGLLALTVRIMRVINPRAFIGWGDLKFLVAVSFWIGLDGSLAVLLMACVVHVLVVLVMTPWCGLGRDRLRPFGPMLALVALAVIVAAFMRANAA